MTCNDFQNFTKFSRASIRLHSGGIVGLNFCYPPTLCHWTTPADTIHVVSANFRNSSTRRDEPQQQIIHTIEYRKGVNQHRQESEKDFYVRDESFERMWNK